MPKEDQSQTNTINSAWPLYGDDLTFARSWLWPQLQPETLTLESGHMAINLGMIDTIEALIKQESENIDPRWIRHWRFRLARLNREVNPYTRLVPLELQDACAKELDHVFHRTRKLIVDLIGGIGDHLETISLIAPYANRHQLELHLVASKTRLNQIKSLLPKSIQLHLKDDYYDHALNNMILKERILTSEPTAPFGKWINIEKSNQPPKLICCWRAEGKEQPFSAHSRSVPFQVVMHFYQKYSSLFPDIPIVDISLWKPWESAALKAFGVKIHDPRNGSLLDLAQLCLNHTVITIDTALAHLCAAMGQPAKLLLCLHHDERWQELRQPHHSYMQTLSIHHASEFGRWSSVIECLLQDLESSEPST